MTATLKPQDCTLFELPFFQFSQLRKYAPDEIEPLKAAYKQAWNQWRQIIRQTADLLGEDFAPAHIERWSNGWQLRAHFFAFFKYRQYQSSASILSIILNRRRLSLSLDWHAYRADRSAYSLDYYQQWAVALNQSADLRRQYADFELWQDSDSEYADYKTLAEHPNPLPLLVAPHYYIIGKQLNASELGAYDSSQWLAEHIRALLPLYEIAHQPIEAGKIRTNALD